MRRYAALWSVCLFVVAFFAADRLLSLGFHKVLQNSRFREAVLYSGELKADVVLIGNSRSLALDARMWSEKLCRPVYNLSLNGLDMRTLYAQLADMLSGGLARPKSVIIEISNLVEADVDRPVAAELLPFAGPGTHTGDLGVSSLNSLIPWTEISHLRRYNSELTFRALYYLRGADDQDWTGMDSRITEGKILAFGRQAKERKITESSMAVLNDVVDLLHKQQVDFKFLILPYHPTAFRGHWTPHDWAKAIGARPGSDVVDASNLLSNDDDFSDVMHLNRRGGRDLLDRLTSETSIKALSACSGGEHKS